MILPPNDLKRTRKLATVLCVCCTLVLLTLVGLWLLGVIGSWGAYTLILLCPLVYLLLMRWGYQHYGKS